MPEPLEPPPFSAEDNVSTLSFSQMAELIVLSLREWSAHGHK